MNFILMFVKNCLQFDAIHNFSVWLRTCSNPADINRIRSHTGNIIIVTYEIIINGWKLVKLWTRPAHSSWDLLLFPIVTNLHQNTELQISGKLPYSFK